jgi:hypothetical protein
MDIYALICTRTREDISPVTDHLLSFLSRCGIKILLISGAKSLFRAYEGAFEKTQAKPEDIIIMCHDDIEIREKPEIFVEKLKTTLDRDMMAFTGPAGTTFLGQDAVWWDQERWQQRFHRGKVTHVDPEKGEYLTQYGPPDDVVALDGLFLAAKADVIRAIGLSKPDYFSGEWDFYDIHYTTTAYLKGYTNTILDIDIVHHSRGELVGRDSWHANRAAFIENKKLPIRIFS